MDNLIPFTIFGSGIAFGIVLVILFVAFILSDLEEKGTIAAVAALIFIAINYLWGTFPILSFLTFKNVFIYLLVGFIFSLIRTLFKGRELTPEQKKRYNLKSSVFRWWFLFPFSAINWIFGSLLKDLYNWVYSKISKVYDYIFNL